MGKFIYLVWHRDIEIGIRCTIVPIEYSSMDTCTIRSRYLARYRNKSNSKTRRNGGGLEAIETPVVIAKAIAAGNQRQSKNCPRPANRWVTARPNSKNENMESKQANQPLQLRHDDCSEVNRKKKKKQAKNCFCLLCVVLFRNTD